MSAEEEYHEKHKEYCEWFTGNIKTVERKKMGRIIISKTTTIEDIDEEKYNELQKMIYVLDDLEKLFAGEIFPVQYGDIKWMELNR